MGRPTTDLIIPDVFACTGVISIPFSMTFVMSKTARDIAIAENSEASARCMPGQIRRPYPKHTFRGSRWAFRSVVAICLSGLKVNGSGYVSGSWSMFLRNIDPVRKSQKKRGQECVPEISNYDRPFGNKITINYTIFHGRVGYTCADINVGYFVKRASEKNSNL